jgi:hypothetical protein
LEEEEHLEINPIIEEESKNLLKKEEEEEEEEVFGEKVEVEERKIENENL